MDPMSRMMAMVLAQYATSSRRTIVLREREKLNGSKMPQIFTIDHENSILISHLSEIDAIEAEADRIVAAAKVQ